MRYPVHVFETDAQGRKVEAGRPFYLSPAEFEAMKAEAFVRLWSRAEVSDVAHNGTGPLSLEVTDQWGRVLFELAGPALPSEAG